jgi:flagellar biosynthesis protein FliP
MVSKVDGSMATISQANVKVDKAQKTVERSGKDVALAFNNVMTSGMALYNAVDKVQDMQLQVDRANLQVKTSLQDVEKAQSRYNDALTKFGADSPQALKAQTDLEIAQERYRLATEKSQNMQDNMNQAMLQSALTVIPSLITMITSVSTITTSWTTVTKGVSAALTFLQANPIMLAITAIAILVTALIAAYECCPPFRDAINAIGNVLGGALSTAIKAVSGFLTALWNNVLAPLAAFIVDRVVGAWKDLVDFWNNVLKPIVDTVGKWFTDVWNNILAPFGTFLKDTLLKAWDTLCGGFDYAYKHFLKPIFDAIQTFYNTIIKPVADFFAGVGSALSGVGSAISGAVGNVGSAIMGRQKGGLVTKPEIALLGEAGPEMVIPLSGARTFQGLGTTVNINSPLIYVQGSADEATVQAAVKRLEKLLGNVSVEPSSSMGLSTHKQIRFGNLSSGRSHGYP